MFHLCGWICGRRRNKHWKKTINRRQRKEKEGSDDLAEPLLQDSSPSPPTPPTSPPPPAPSSPEPPCLKYLAGPVTGHDISVGLRQHTENRADGTAVAFLPRPPFETSQHSCQDGDVEEFVVASDKGLCIYRLHKDSTKAPTLMARSSLPFKTHSIAASPDGRMVVAGGEGGVVHIYQVHRGGHDQDEDDEDEDSDDNDELRERWRMIGPIACVPSTRSSVSSVSFGSFAGATRLIVAGSLTPEQEDSIEQGVIYFFTYYSKFGDCGECPPFPRWHHAWGNLPDSLLPIRPSSGPDTPNMGDVAVGISWPREPDPQAETMTITTAAIGPFNDTLSCVTASPDGAWLAATFKDRLPVVILIPANDPGFTAPMRLLTLPDSAIITYRPPFKEASFSPDSRLIAATGYFTSLLVWDVASGDLLHRVTSPGNTIVHGKALAWWGGMGKTVVYVERRGNYGDIENCYIIDLACPEQKSVRLTLQIPSDFKQSSSHKDIKGLVVSPGGRLLLLCPSRLYEGSLASAWSTQKHKRFPPAFKSATRLLLMAQRFGSKAPSHASGAVPTDASSLSPEHALDDGSGAMTHHQDSGVWDLDHDLLMELLSFLAIPVSCWIRKQTRQGMANEEQKWCRVDCCSMVWEP